MSGWRNTSRIGTAPSAIAVDHCPRLVDPLRPVGEERRRGRGRRAASRTPTAGSGRSRCRASAASGARRLPPRSTSTITPGGADVDRLPEAPVVVRVDEERRDEADRADQREDHLPHEVVVGLPGTSWAVIPLIAQRPKPTSAPTAPSSSQSSRADRGGEPVALVAVRPQASRSGVDGLDHQSEYAGPVDAAVLVEELLEHLQRGGRRRVPPWPPFSISAQTTSSGSPVPAGRSRTTTTGRTCPRGSARDRTPSRPSPSCRRSSRGSCRRPRCDVP